MEDITLWPEATQPASTQVPTMYLKKLQLKSENTKVVTRYRRLVNEQRILTYVARGSISVWQTIRFTCLDSAALNYIELTTG